MSQRENPVANGVMKSDFNADGHKIVNLNTPTLDDDAATKKYVDDNAGFSPTDSQLDAMNSGVTAAKVAAYDGYAAAIAGKYTKPSTGIPAADLASSVQTSLGKADTALQPADVPTPSSTAPVMDGTATPGVSNDYARGDHVHPSDTSRVPTSRTVNGNALTGDVTLTGADIPVSDMDSTKINAALAGKADCVSNPTDGHLAALDENGNLTDSGKAPNDFALIGDIAPDWMDTTEIGTVFVADQLCSFSGRTYRCILGYTFAGEDTPPADTTHWALATVEDVLAALRTGKADTSALTAHTGNATIHVTAADKTAWNGKQSALSQAQLDAVNSGITAAKVSAYDGYAATIAGKADAADLRYALTTKTISNGAVTLDDRAINAVAVSSSLASLTVNFPAATSGKARDFGVRLTVASGITTAPQLVLPQGVTCENADGTAPEIGADGAATILYFTETASGVFLVKGEVVQTIS